MNEKKTIMTKEKQNGRVHTHSQKKNWWNIQWRCVVMRILKIENYFPRFRLTLFGCLWKTISKHTQQNHHNANSFCVSTTPEKHKTLPLSLYRCHSISVTLMCMCLCVSTTVYHLRCGQRWAKIVCNRIHLNQHEWTKLQFSRRKSTTTTTNITAVAATAAAHYSGVYCLEKWAYCRWFRLVCASLSTIILLLHAKGRTRSKR